MGQKLLLLSYFPKQENARRVELSPFPKSEKPSEVDIQKAKVVEQETSTLRHGEPISRATDNNLVHTHPGLWGQETDRQPGHRDPASALPQLRTVHLLISWEFGEQAWLCTKQTSDPAIVQCLWRWQAQHYLVLLTGAVAAPCAGQGGREARRPPLQLSHQILAQFIKTDVLHKLIKMFKCKTEEYHRQPCILAMVREGSGT